MPKFVYDFTEGNKDLKDLLRRQGREPRRDDQPRPARAARFHDHHRGVPLYLQRGTTPDGLDDEVSATSQALEKKMGKQLGDPADPLLVSVRSGAKFSMPGMMDTVLNIGLNDESVAGPGQADGQRAVRLGLLPAPHPDVRQDRARRRRRALRARDRRRQAGQGRQQRHRPERRGPAEPGRDVQGDRQEVRRAGVPAGPARADGPARSRPSSTRGTPTAPSSTAARSASPPTWARP